MPPQLPARCYFHIQNNSLSQFILYSSLPFSVTRPRPRPLSHSLSLCISLSLSLYLSLSFSLYLSLSLSLSFSLSLTQILTTLISFIVWVHRIKNTGTVRFNNTRQAKVSDSYGTIRATHKYICWLNISKIIRWKEKYITEVYRYKDKHAHK